MTLAVRARLSPAWHNRVLGARRLAWLLLFCLPLSACGNPPTPLPTAEAVLARAALSMQALRSAHFIVERTGAPAYVDANSSFIFRRAEGDFAAPDQGRAVVRVIGPALVADVKVVALGDRYWETNPLTGAWGNFSGLGYNPATLFNAETGLPALMRQELTNLQLKGLAALDGYPGEKFYLLTAEAPGEPAAQMTDGLVGRGRVQLVWWIAPQTGYVVQLQVTEPETDPKDPTVWLVVFEAFDKPVTLTPPAP
jgi:hypothetical protein